jgi:hypothetical protein
VLFKASVLTPLKKTVQTKTTFNVFAFPQIGNPEAPLKCELTFDTFNKRLTAERHLLTCTRRCNLAPSQRHVLSELSSRADLIVSPTDKNLGRCVVERKVHVSQAFKFTNVKLRTNESRSCANRIAKTEGRFSRDVL